MKLLPPKGFPPTKPANLGIVTQSAISVPEGEAPDRARTFCMAVTNKDLSGDRPTSWSAAMDQAAAGTMPGELDDPAAPRRLLIISAGNIPDYAKAVEAADSAMFPIEDPAQAWNPLTIGGFTDRDHIAHPLYKSWSAAAAVGDRSPYSRMSRAWPDTTPIKPEIVFEAGNRALSPNGVDFMAGIESLSVLSTNKDWVTDPLGPFWATSAATGEAVRMAAQIMAAHPGYWAEAVRALMVHSARWTPAMWKRFKEAKSRKAQHIGLAREFGYGVPSLTRALASASSDLGLVSQATIQPFKVPMKRGKRGQEIPDGTPKFNESMSRRTNESLPSSALTANATARTFRHGADRISNLANNLLRKRRSRLPTACKTSDISCSAMLILSRSSRTKMNSAMSPSAGTSD